MVLVTVVVLALLNCTSDNEDNPAFTLTTGLLLWVMERLIPLLTVTLFLPLGEQTV